MFGRDLESLFMQIVFQLVILKNMSASIADAFLRMFVNSSISESFKCWKQNEVDQEKHAGELACES